MRKRRLAVEEEEDEGVKIPLKVTNLI